MSFVQKAATVAGKPDHEATGQTLTRAKAPCIAEGVTLLKKDESIIPRKKL